MLAEDMGKQIEAEKLYKRTIEISKQLGDAINTAVGLNNLANLLCEQSGRLTETRLLAQEALEKLKTTEILDSAMVEIWKTYYVLERIANKQGDTQETKKYHRLAPMPLS